MPQVVDEDKLKSWWLTVGVNPSPLTITPKQLVNVDDYCFSQGEVSAAKILGFTCNFGGKNIKDNAGVRFADDNTKPSKDDPYVCSDKYILDGHHRFAAYKFWNAHFLASIPSPKIAQLNVNVINVPATALIKALLPVIDWTTKTVWIAPTDPPSATSGQYDVTAAAAIAPIGAVGDVAAAIKVAGLVELEARFGVSAHATVAAARSAYVEQTRQRLADAGMVLKGGDEALAMRFDTMHAPILWK